MPDLVSIQDMASIIMDQMDEYSRASSEEIKEIVKNVGKEARAELKRNSPKRTGEYSKKWTMKVEKENSTSINVAVYDKKYALVHLLEKGHQLRRGGRSIGIVKPVEHVAKVQEKADKELERRILEVL